MGKQERDKLGDWDRYTLPYVMWIANKYPLYGTGNSTQYSAMTYMTKESKKEWIYIYVESKKEWIYIYVCVCIYIYMIHFAVPQKLT